MSINREVRGAPDDAVMKALKAQRSLFDAAFGLHELVRRGAQSATSREYPPPASTMTIDAEYTVGEAKHE